MIFRHSVFLDLAGLSSSLRFPLLEFGAGGGGGGEVRMFVPFQFLGFGVFSAHPPFHHSTLPSFLLLGSLPYAQNMPASGLKDIPSDQK